MNNYTGRKHNIWWGPPRKFSTSIEERKISWLELFYDLVYVIVISRITHHLATNPCTEGIVDYFLLFLMIFWGWINGSMYHDLHGSLGIRTRFMTLWQMMAVAALAVTMSGPPELFVNRGTIALIFLQFYITYLWWSVGIYDKNHRKLNRPYTFCYLIALSLIFITLYVSQPYKRILFGLALVFNYLPPFFAAFHFGKRNLNLNLSPSMAERLGLFTIIVFGEAILGVINGASDAADLNAHVWEGFGMGILIVFALWWIFFSLIADREIKSGFIRGQIMSMLYIPALASLGIIGAIFSMLIKNIDSFPAAPLFLKELFGVSLFVFLLSIWAISLHLHYPKEYNASGKIMRLLIISSGLCILLITFFFGKLSFLFYMGLIFCIFFVIIVAMTRIWFKLELKRLDEEELLKK
ncbi:MAG: low temperature requirement protein A [Bacteroidota bacterium]|nr:low temperature requirement protein A [Bacteroidota bacterium]